MHKEIANYLYELGVLKRVRRSGWWLAGVKDAESVAEHSFRRTGSGKKKRCVDGNSLEFHCRPRRFEQAVVGVKRAQKLHTRYQRHGCSATIVTSQRIERPERSQLSNLDQTAKPIVKIGTGSEPTEWKPAPAFHQIQRELVLLGERKLLIAQRG